MTSRDGGNGSPNPVLTPPPSSPQNAATAMAASDALLHSVPPPPSRRRGQRPLAALPRRGSPAPSAPAVPVDGGDGSRRTHHAPAVLPPLTGGSGGERGGRLPPIAGLDAEQRVQADAGPGTSPQLQRLERFLAPLFLAPRCSGLTTPSLPLLDPKSPRLPLAPPPSLAPAADDYILLFLAPRCSGFSTTTPSLPLIAPQMSFAGCKTAQPSPPRLPLAPPPSHAPAASPPPLQPPGPPQRAAHRDPDEVPDDEMDAIGTKRFDSDVSGDREVQQTMLEILNQLDGFSSGEKIKESYLSSPQMSVGIGDKHQASVPEWENAPSEEDTDDYRAESLSRMGTVVCPLNMDISASDEKRKTRKESVDNCNCTHPGSEDCVRVHVTKARVWIKDQLGEEAFKNCGLDAMGEQVGELWTAVEKKKLEAVCKLIRQNDQSFVEITKDLSPKQTKDLLKYYYNVIHPRSLARLTREEHKKKEAVDRDDQKSSQSDENNERRPRKKGRSSGSSSTRCRK